MKNLVQPRYLPVNPNKSYFSYNEENERFSTCQRKNKKTIKGFNMILTQIFYILICDIFRLSGKAKPI